MTVLLLPCRTSECHYLSHSLLTRQVSVFFDVCMQQYRCGASCAESHVHTSVKRRISLINACGQKIKGVLIDGIFKF